MERGVTSRQRTTKNEDALVTDNKTWVTVAYNCNLGHYESYRIEAGYSQSLKDGDNPIQVIRDMEQRITRAVIKKVEDMREELSDQTKRGK